MPFPDWQELTEREWQAIILVERLRGLSKQAIADLLSCSLGAMEPHWKVFTNYEGDEAENEFEYLYSSRGVRVSLKERVYRHMDSVFQDNLPPCTSGVLADVFEEDAVKIAQYMDQWSEDVSARVHFPRCRSCKFRGHNENPILENGVCLQCNAKLEGWPLGQWREDGRFAALLYHWGLIREDIVADYIKGGNGYDSRGGAEADRPYAGRRQHAMAAGA